MLWLQRLRRLRLWLQGMWLNDDADEDDHPDHGDDGNFVPKTSSARTVLTPTDGSVERMNGMNIALVENPSTI